MLYLAYYIWISKCKQCRTANYVEPEIKPCIFVSIKDIIVKFWICAGSMQNLSTILANTVQHTYFEIVD